MEYILQCIRKIQQENIKALEVKSKPIDQLYKYIDKWHEGSVFSENCKRYLARRNFYFTKHICLFYSIFLEVNS